MKCAKRILLVALAVTIMLRGNHTVLAEGENPFADVKESDWYYPYATYAYENNLMNGKGKDENGLIIFDPGKSITRAEFVQILYNKEGVPSVDITDSFQDVKEGDWYAKAVSWAATNGIVVGKGDIFDVSSPITRQEMATVLCKYANNYLGYDTPERTSCDRFSDKSQIAGWALDYMEWAVHYGIMKGKGECIDPKASATRAESATMLKNFVNAFESKEDDESDEEDKLDEMKLRVNEKAVLVSEAELIFCLETSAKWDKVELYEVSDQEKFVVTMFDDGNLQEHGDETAGDGIFSARYVELPNEDISKVFVAKAEGIKSESKKSNEVIVDFFIPFTEEELGEMDTTNNMIRELVDSEAFKEATVEEKKILAEEVIEELVKANYIKEESVSYNEESRVFSFEYSSGVLGGIILETYPAEFDELEEELEKYLEKQAEEEMPAVATRYMTGKRKVLILNAFPDFESFEDKKEDKRVFYEDLKTELESKKGAEVTLNRVVSPDSFRTFEDYDIVCISTHGVVSDKGRVIYMLAYAPDMSINKRYCEALKVGAIDTYNGLYAITPLFFEHYYDEGDLDNLFVISESCESMGCNGKVDYSMANAFLSRGASTYVGFHNSVLSGYSREFMGVYVKKLIDKYSAKIAFNEAVEEYGENHKIWYDRQADEAWLPNWICEWLYNDAAIAYPILVGDENATTRPNTLVIGEGLTKISIDKKKHYDKVTIESDDITFTGRPFEGIWIKEVEIKEGVTKIPTDLFYGSRIDKISIADSVESIGCYTFANAQLPDCFPIGKNIKEIGHHAFAGSDIKEIEKLEIGEGSNLDFSVFDDITIKEMVLRPGTEIRVDKTFSGVTIQKVTVSDDVTKIPNSIFWGSTIEEIDIPESVDEICGYAFYEAKLPSDFTIGKNIKKINIHAFDGSSLKEIEKLEIGEGTNMESGVFKDIYIKEVVLHSGTNIRVYESFNGATIKKVTIMDEVTKIPRTMFWGSTIEEIEIPEGVEEIGGYAFYGAKLPNDFKISDKVTVGHMAFEGSTYEYAE